MENLKEPGISLKHVMLLKAFIEAHNPKATQQYNLQLVGLQRTESEDGKSLFIQASFDLMHMIDTPMFKFTCDFAAYYERRNEESMAWKDFSSPVALAHIMPYLREFVNNITHRLPAPVLVLDPINTRAMIREYQQRPEAPQPPTVG